MTHFGDRILAFYFFSTPPTCSLSSSKIRLKIIDDMNLAEVAQSHGIYGKYPLTQCFILTHYNQGLGNNCEERNMNIIYFLLVAVLWPPSKSLSAHQISCNLIFPYPMLLQFMAISATDVRTYETRSHAVVGSPVRHAIRRSSSNLVINHLSC